MGCFQLDGESLRTFVTVADCGGFTAAAERVHRTQSAVSQQIKRLEDTLGVRLIVRTSRRMTLTPEGERFLGYARRILLLHEEAVSAVAGASRQANLRVGIPDDYAESLLPVILPRFEGEHPGVRPDIHCAMSSELLRSLEAGALDLALTIRHGGASRGRLLRREDLVWVADRRFDACGTTRIPLALFPEGCPYRARAVDGLSSVQREWSVVSVSQSMTGIRIAVEQQGAVTITSRRTMPRHWRILDEATGFPPIPPAELELHNGTSTAPNEATNAFETFLRDALATLG